MGIRRLSANARFEVRGHRGDQRTDPHAARGLDRPHVDSEGNEMAGEMNALAHHGPRDPLAPLWEDRLRRIREAAYFKAEKRGFAPGHELDDWLEAEEEVDQASRPLPED